VLIRAPENQGGNQSFLRGAGGIHCRKNGGDTLLGWEREGFFEFIDD